MVKDQWSGKNNTNNKISNVLIILLLLNIWIVKWNNTSSKMSNVHNVFIRRKRFDGENLTLIEDAVDQYILSSTYLFISFDYAYINGST